LHRVDVGDQVEFGRIVAIFRCYDRVRQIRQRFADILEPGFDLVAVSDGDYVLAGRMDADSFKSVSRKFAWTSYFYVCRTVSWLTESTISSSTTLRASKRNVQFA